MEFKVIQENDISILIAPARLELATSNHFKKTLLDVVNKGSYKLVIDLSNTTFIDSNGISSLIARLYVCRSNRGDVRLANVSDHILDIFTITNLHKIFKIYQNQQAAIDSYH